jgi:hypothetical protein
VTGAVLAAVFYSAVALSASCTGGGETGKEKEAEAPKPVAEAYRGYADKAPEPAPERPPSVRIIPVSPGVESDLHAAVSGNGRSFAFTWLKDGEEVEGEKGSTLRKGGYRKGDEVTVVVAVNGLSARSSVVIADTAPSVAKVSLAPQFIYRGVDITAEVEATDPDGDEVGYEYQWIINGEESPLQTGKALKGDRFGRGDTVTVRVVPISGAGASALKGEPYTPFPVTIPNGPPAFTTTPPLEFNARVYSYRAEAVDPDGDPVSYALSAAPDGMEIDAAGAISWAVKKDQGGANEVEITADDGRGGKAFQRYTVTVGFAAAKP